MHTVHTDLRFFFFYCGFRCVSRIQLVSPNQCVSLDKPGIYSRKGSCSRWQSPAEQSAQKPPDKILKRAKKRRLVNQSVKCSCQPLIISCFTNLLEDYNDWTLRILWNEGTSLYFSRVCASYLCISELKMCKWCFKVHFTFLTVLKYNKTSPRRVAPKTRKWYGLKPHLFFTPFNI